MTIGICSDHAGLEYKTKLIAYLLKKGYEVVNFGTDSPEISHTLLPRRWKVERSIRGLPFAARATEWP